MASLIRNTWSRVFARARTATWLLACVACPAPGDGATESTGGGSDTTGTGTSTGGSTTVASGSSSTTTDGTTAPTSGPVGSSTSSSSASSTSMTDDPTGSSTTSASTDSTIADPSSTTQGEVCPGGSVHEGDLVITDDTDLAALTCITEVTGDLKILGTSLTTFLELGNLESVHGDVEIGENPALVNLDGLVSLSVVGDGGFFTGEITIYNNPSLVDITGLQSLAKIDWLRIEGCDVLTDLTGPQGEILSFNPKGWGLALSNNASLENLDGLLAIETLRRRVALSDNPTLSDISALEFILAPDAEPEINIVGNPALMDLIGLEVVKQAFVVQIVDNDGLSNLHGLDNLQTASDGIQIADNDGLTSLTGLGQLSSVENFYIENNPVLASLSGLDSLTSVHTLRVGDCTNGNASLVDLHGLENVANIVALEVRKNTNLIALDGLNGLQSLAQLVAEFNPMLPPAEATDLAAQFGANIVLCNNLGPPEDCECTIMP